MKDFHRNCIAKKQTYVKVMAKWLRASPVWADLIQVMKMEKRLQPLHSLMEREFWGTSDEDSCTINMLGVKFFTNDEKKIAKTMMGIIETCDGSVDTAEAGNIGKKIIRAYQEGTAYRDDSGIAYGLTRQLSRSGNYMFIVRLT